MNRDILNPKSALTWTTLGTIMVALVGTSFAMGAEPRLGILSLLAVLAVLGVTTAAIVVVIRVIDLYRTGGVLPLLLATAAGATIVPWVARSANKNLLDAIAAAFGRRFSSMWAAAIAGPLTEEWLKGVCVLMVLLLMGAASWRPVQGMLVGAASGLGFQVVEDILYALRSGQTSLISEFNGAVGTTAARSFFGPISHWLYSAIVGAGIALALGWLGTPASSRSRRTLVLAVALMLTGTGVHALWNSPLELTVGVWVVAVKFVLAIATFAAVVVWATTREGDHLEAHAARKGQELERWRAMRRRTRKVKGRSARRQERRRWRQEVQALQATC